MKKRLLHIFLLNAALLVTLVTHAQQDAKFNQYMFNPLGINPAYAGSREVLSTVLLWRNQWVGFEGAPVTETFAIHGPLVRRKMGLGFQVTNDNIGPRNIISAEVDYAYRFPFLKGKLSFGLGAGVNYYSFDWNKIDYKDQGDVVPAYGVRQAITPDADFGIWYNTNKLYAGLELAHLTQSRINITDTTVNSANAYRQFRHYSFTMGRAFMINRTYTLKPSILYKQAGLYMGMLDLNLSVLINNKLWLGVTARPKYGAVAIFEYVFNRKYRLGYSFDYPLNDLRYSHGSSHEIFLGIDFGIPRSNTVSPRYF